MLGNFSQARKRKRLLAFWIKVIRLVIPYQVSQRFVFPRVICSPEHWALVLCVPPSPPHKTIQCYMCSLFIMPVSCVTCLLLDFFVLIIVQMNESLHDNIVVDKYVLRRTTKKYSVRNNASQQRSLDRL